ncbi:hypothetical protein [Roseimaritima sediminicola]|uniref:hypothetical protein n=1 Tax=Roseimaritima sediminicola TaxID=2662066 RepID=UPI00129839E7|nr:hypothetical protein [Roseimaritima sediminicola]
MNQPTDDCGEQTGMTAAILMVCGIIPCIGFLFSIAALVFIGMYLVKVWECKGRAEQLAIAGGDPGQWAAGPQPLDPNNPYAS